MEPASTTSRQIVNWKMPMEKPPLVTPSASPPPPPLPPTKRSTSRVTSTPKPGGFLSTNGQRSSSLSSYSTSLSSASKQPQRQQSFSAGDDIIDIHKEREASIMRLLGAWSQLDRHVKRLDEDDIVHLGTGKIIKDNGVLRGLRAVKFGDDAEEEDEDEEEDEEDDQLDTLGEEDVSEDEELDIQVQVPAPTVPPAQHNAKDAEDLRAFLELGKNIGSEPEDDDIDGEGLYEEASSEGQSEGTYDLDEERDDDELPAITGGGSDPTVPEESDSEDELNCNWAEDEASIVIPVAKLEEPFQFSDDDDDIIEIIETPLPPKTKQSALHPKKRKSQSHLQLYTPPHSRSSEQPPPDENFITPPPFTFPPADITPEIPIIISKFQKVINPVPPLPKSPSLKKNTKPKPSALLLSTSHLQPPASGANTENENTILVPKKSFKLVPEVVIERIAPFPEPQPSAPQDTESVAPPKPTSKMQTALGSTRRPRSKMTKSVVELQSEREDVAHPPEKKLSQKSSTLVTEVFPTPEADGSKSKPNLAVPSASEIASKAEAPKVLPPASPRKRKRSLTRKVEEISRSTQDNAIASSSKTKITSDSEDAEPSTKSSKDARRSVQQRSPRKPRRSKSRSRRLEYHSESEGHEESQRYGQYPARSGSRHPPQGMFPYHHPPPMYPHPPPPQHMNPPPASGSSAGVFGPSPLMPNQTQYIVSQVMQQLTAMATGHWGPMPPVHPFSSPLQQNHSGHGGPFTPTHQHQHYHRSKSKGPPNVPGYEEYSSHDGYGGNVYSTPQHHHMYPYMYNADMSRGTAPPETPEHALRSSSPIGQEDLSPGRRVVRKKSLVERSRSRGRRVTFKTRGGGGRRGSDDEVDAFSSSPLRSKGKGREPPKGRALSSEDSEVQSESSDDDDKKPFVRGQTPGPCRKNNL